MAITVTIPAREGVSITDIETAEAAAIAAVEAQEALSIAAVAAAPATVIDAAEAASLAAIEAAEDAILTPTTGTLAVAEAAALAAIASAEDAILTPVTGTLAVAEAAAIEAVTDEGDTQDARVAAEGAAQVLAVAATPGSTEYASTANAISKGVWSVAVTAGGTGGTDGTYYWSTTGGAGADAVGYLTVAGGAITAVYVTHRGQGYTSAPTIVIAGTHNVTGHTLTPAISQNQPAGTYFIVKTSDGFAVYIVDAGGTTTTLQETFPTITAVKTYLAAVSLYRTIPAATNALVKILAVEIYKSVGGVAVTLPTNFGIREMGRDATSGGRFRVRWATFDGASTYTQEIREGASTLNDGTAIGHNGTYLTAAATLVGQQWIDLYTITTNLGPAIGTKIGRALIDFDTGAVFGTYAGNIASSAGRLWENRLQNGARFVSDVQEQVLENSAVSYLARSQSPLLTLPRPTASAAALGVLRCTSITIDPTYPLGSSLVVLRWCGLRSSDAYFWAKLATFDGVSTYTDFCTTGGNAPINTTGYTGLYTLNLTALAGNAFGITAGTVVGTIEIDFGTLTKFGSYGNNITYAEGGLVNSRIQFSSGDTTAVNALARVQALAVAASPAFLTTCTNTYIQPIVSDIYIEGGDAGERYCLNYAIQDLGSGNGRVRFTLYDTILGIDVCTSSTGVDTKANIVAYTTETLVLWQSDMAGFTGITATIWVNWANITTWSGAMTSYTTMAATGIRADRTISPQEMRARFKAGPEPKTLLTVGAGTVTATHFNTLLAALQSLYDPDLTVTRSGPFPLSDKCSFSNQVMIRVIDDAYSEQITLIDIAGSNQSPAVFPPFLTVEAPQDALIYSNEVSNTGPTIEAPFPFRIRGGTWDCQGSGYAIHIDGVNGIAKRATVGPAILRYPLVSIMEEATFKGGSTQVTWTIGTGLSNGQDFIMDRCRVVMRKAAVVGIGAHDSPTTTDAGEVTITDTYVNDVAIGGTGIQLLKSNARTVQHRVTVRNTNTGSISVSNTAGGAAGYIRNGKIDSAITITGTLDT